MRGGPTAAAFEDLVWNRQLVGARRDIAEPEVHECIAQPSSVGRRRLDEDVEILRQPWLTVTCDRVAPDEYEPDSSGDQR